MPAPFISAKLTGTMEITQAIDTMIQKQQQTVIPSILEKAGALGERIAKAKAHVITGNMKSKVGHKQTAKNTMEVFALAEYSVYENARKGSKGGLGTHDFFTQSRNEVLKQFPKMIVTDIEKNIRENKARTPTR